MRAGIIGLLFLTATSSAAAAAPTAEELLAQGVEARRKGDHATALELFRSAHAAEPSPRTLAQMGLAELSLRRWLDSEMHLGEALEQPKFPWIRKNRGPLDEALASARAHIGTIAVSGPVGAHVAIGQRAVGVLPLSNPAKVEEGKTTVTVRSTGFLDFVQEVTVVGGKVLSVTAELVPDRRQLPSVSEGQVAAAPSSAALSTSAADTPRGPRALGWTLIGTGIAAVAAGVVLVAMDGKGTCTPAPGGVCNDLYKTKLGGFALIGGGVVAGATGGFLIYRGARARVAAAPALNGGFVLAGSF